MHLNVVHIMWVFSSVIHDLFEEDLLCWCVRMGNGDRVCRMVGGSLENDAQDAIIVGKGVVESLQDHRPNTVTSAIYSNLLGVCVEHSGYRVCLQPSASLSKV